MNKLPFAAQILLSILVTCVGATIGTYVWEAAETTTLFHGQYGGGRRLIWGIFSGLMCFCGFINTVAILVKRIEV
jgi:hypothetical protein